MTEEKKAVVYGSLTTVLLIILVPAIACLFVAGLDEFDIWHQRRYEEVQIIKAHAAVEINTIKADGWRKENEKAL